MSKFSRLHRRRRSATTSIHGKIQIAEYSCHRIFLAETVSEPRPSVVLNLADFPCPTNYIVRMERVGEEKRQYPRVSASTLIVEIYSAFRKTEPLGVCSVADVGEGGMGFISNKHFEPGQLLRLTFSLPGSMLLIRTDARVIHCIPHANGYGIGAQFHDLGPAERRLLQLFIYRALKRG
ncbi:MAG: hypothetical protein GF344_18555 [Chitinivibrionales bacterium]|nr:hypothetical protein [Chitinivibrionales bacterium]MBD3358650.1 hypothetical protein [Chitinivibrionales bacterium]